MGGGRLREVVEKGGSTVVVFSKQCTFICSIIVVINQLIVNYYIKATISSTLF